MAMDSATRAWLLDELGASTDVADLETRYTRLRTARAVAISVIRSRLADLRAQPAAVNVSSVVGVTYTENIKAYERQLTILESGQPPAPDEPQDDDSSDSDGTLGVIQLVARPRR
jgi:hypothetical protein